MLENLILCAKQGELAVSVAGSPLFAVTGALVGEESEEGGLLA